MHLLTSAVSVSYCCHSYSKVVSPRNIKMQVTAGSVGCLSILIHLYINVTAMFKAVKAVNLKKEKEEGFEYGRSIRKEKMKGIM